jgi:hypothetical protein
MGSAKTRKVVEWYHRSRAVLVKALGGRCVYCGVRDGLQFHHVGVRTWVASKLSRWCRLARYKREAALGEVVLACASCNKEEGQPGLPDF